MGVFLYTQSKLFIYATSPPSTNVFWRRILSICPNSANWKFTPSTCIFCSLSSISLSPWTRGSREKWVASIKTWSFSRNHEDGKWYFMHRMMTWMVSISREGRNLIEISGLTLLNCFWSSWGTKLSSYKMFSQEY